ncbi:hypothetical protein, partial [Thermogemmatispora aurantia]|uniref:hypothetical protein n=1 Tax=Thermogemmatispora aurantia TaxID=2045279 RepID=UPI001D142C36
AGASPFPIDIVGIYHIAEQGVSGLSWRERVEGEAEGSFLHLSSFWNRIVKGGKEGSQKLFELFPEDGRGEKKTPVLFLSELLLPGGDAWSRSIPPLSRSAPLRKAQAHFRCIADASVELNRSRQQQRDRGRSDAGERGVSGRPLSGAAWSEVPSPAGDGRPGDRCPLSVDEQIG